VLPLIKILNFYNGTGNSVINSQSKQHIKSSIQNEGQDRQQNLECANTEDIDHANIHSKFYSCLQ